jgi:hypothetical protein
MQVNVNSVVLIIFISFFMFIFGLPNNPILCLFDAFGDALNSKTSIKAISTLVVAFTEHPYQMIGL